MMAGSGSTGVAGPSGADKRLESESAGASFIQTSMVGAPRPIRTGDLRIRRPRFVPLPTQKNREKTTFHQSVVLNLYGRI